MRRDATLSQRRAAAIYNVSRKTLRRRRAGTPLQRDCTLNSIKLLKSEEDVIIQHILNLNAQGFPPQLATVKEMANSLLATISADNLGCLPVLLHPLS
jgi:hypothetical protein